MKRTTTKHILLLVSLPFLFAQANAQEVRPDRGYLGLSANAGVPFGDFSSTSTGNEDAGYALTGVHFDLTMAYRIGKVLGVTAMIHASANPVDESAVARDFNARYPQANWTINADPWKNLGFLLGGFASFPANDHFTAEVRLMGGLISSTSPRLNATATAAGVDITGTRKEKSEVSGAIDAGIVLRYRIAPAICVMANVDFLTSNISFKDVETTTPFGNSTSDFNQNLRLLNAGIGIGVLFR